MCFDHWAGLRENAEESDAGSTSVLEANRGTNSLTY